jgi:acetyltransferase-like isoleucine patch superfamily enzyme
MSEPIYNIGKDVKIAVTARINVSEYFEIGDRSGINEHVLIEGRYVKLGKECWLDEYAHIGGGSCHDYQSELIAGDFLHMGKFSHINTARKVNIGDECGVGIGTKIFTHGAYESAYDGFPVKFADVTIGNRVWLPNAWVNPGVTIGNNVVVSAMSLVNRDLPSGCLAGGVPVKVLKEDVYPHELTYTEYEALVMAISNDICVKLTCGNGVIIPADNASTTIFDLKNRIIQGNSSEITEKLKNQLRRYGIRFKYYVNNGEYCPWRS